MLEESLVAASKHIDSARAERMARVSSSASPRVALTPVDDTHDDFLYRTYASTRTEEMALTGWGPEQQHAFLRMQFEAQKRSYAAQFPDAKYWVIELDGAPVGRLIVDRSAADILLMDIALLPEFRGKGIGSHLMDQLTDEARQTGKAIRLHVERFSPVLRWYERRGFRTVAESAIYLEMLWNGAVQPRELGTEPCI